MYSTTLSVVFYGIELGHSQKQYAGDNNWTQERRSDKTK
jgi:hypothetical protein